MADPTLLALFLVAALAAGIDAIAGGGGLLTLPALLLAGLDPVAALATNKVQSSAGSTSATVVFVRRAWSPGRLASPSSPPVPAGPWPARRPPPTCRAGCCRPRCR